MSNNPSSKLIYENNENYIDNEDNKLNQTPSYMNFSNEFSNPLIEPKIFEFYEYYSFFCKKCERVPDEFNISTKGKISYICGKGEENEKVHKDLTIKELYDNLFYSKDIDSRNEKLKCFFHNEKFIYYCKKCKQNFCFQCSKDCSNHRNELLRFGLDDTDIKEKIDYIKEKIKNKDKIKTNIINFVKENIIKTISQDNTENEELEYDENIIETNEIMKNKNNDEIINIKNESNFGIYDEDEFNYINLFKIIINNYENFPNFELLKTISNIERFASLYFIDYNVINLNYEFDEENIKNNSIVELLGDIFVNNNKDNCFLIIKDQIMELLKNINLVNIFDIPIVSLDVKLIERKRKFMTNLSFMFSGISTITDKSSFDNFDSKNIKEMIYMFYNCKSKHLPEGIAKFNTENVTDMNHMFCKCSSIKKFPDISNWDTKNVTDMSFMFNNCSSLEELPDVSNWDTENVIDMTSMFENCSSITSLPNILGWNIGKIKYMKKMFRNCRKLYDIPDLSNWEINDDTIYQDMFEGDILLENLPKFKIKNLYLSKCFSRFIDFFNTLETAIITICGLDIVLILFFGGILYIMFAYFIPYFIIHNLDKTKECINNPLEYFNLLNNTNINSIVKLKNISEKLIIDEIQINEKLIIEQILNFTSINGNIIFDFDYDKYKILDIIIRYEFFFCLIFLIFAIINYKKKFKYINSSKSIYLLIIIFFLDINSLFLHFKFLSIISKLSESINKYFTRIKKIFGIEIPKANDEELKYLELSSGPIIFIIIIFIITFITVFVLCKKIHNIREINLIFIN